MPDQCPNHGVYSPEQKQAALQKLADALTMMSRGDVPLQPGVREELQYVEIYGGLKDLPMDIGILNFREPSRIHKHKLAYTVDWLAKRQPAEIARKVDERIWQTLSSS